ncbi:hypothetical protein [Pseudohongiella sp.]|uniref:hypothetical protein n=1 Tax=Pseudohongiella sp. TaxID=1979412 RepID=UPI001840358E|nr:hypothetical protein [Pseudohongiella sp.]HDZ09316.1 hypothetical protein [Pseudohongiella sp.]HEA63835.1 hypothetical protein [Pseudohongiella sp.]
MILLYKRRKFDTRLEATWAAFFDLAGWKWKYKPEPIRNWQPSFGASFFCEHSECDGSHTILISVLPVESLDGLEGHPALSYSYSVPGTDADGGALFGSGPAATKWEIAHGSGGGLEDIYFRVDDADEIWKRALTIVKRIHYRAKLAG